ncbi:MAG TPA: DEAD/DEAH box helicase [Firmicutes bacterium]|nr:DEAD/DEAH box helicase [Bacillota bacterium]
MRVIKFLVANEPVEGQDVKGLPPGLVEIFRVGAQSQKAKPFPHQVKAFHLILENRELFLVAGTASGKTLAVGAPLFYKLSQGKIRKILLMYPTVALLEDQRRVVELLAKAAGLNKEVGQLQGGMSRSALIHNLNRHIVLATPDEIYWFFRKNVKYNALLVYGLCQVDEFVLDEAHLFNGLMLRNFEHLWQRVKTLAGCLGKMPRLHVLTATPTNELERLNSAEPIIGKSKCSDVQVELRTSGWGDRAERFANAVNEMLEADSRKVLVVCNSARVAHQLFKQHRVEDTSTIPVEHRLRFGQVTLGRLTQWFNKTNVKKELVDELNKHLFREEDVVLEDVPDGTTIDLTLQDIVAHATEVLERQCWWVKRALWEQSQRPGESWESLLHKRPLPCRIVAAVRKRLDREKGVEKKRAIVDEWLTDAINQFSTISGESIRCRAKEFAELTNVFISTGMDKELASLLTKRLKLEMRASLPLRRLSHRSVYLRWLHVDKDKADKIREVIKVGLESGELEVDCRHIGLWKDTEVPIIVYSGSMAKQAREGLINVFSDLERAVLISTSAVEVGVDFHADTIITEECEANSFLQRFGRVGRHGKGSKAIVFVSGDVYDNLHELNGVTISREEFSRKIADVFPHRSYASASQLLDASQYLINEQLGRIGERLNVIPMLAEAKSIADNLRAADIQLGFGLRSTMPGIGLRDGVTKDPFYLLRYVDDDALRPADSLFWVAQAETCFTSLIFQRAKFDVIVDLEETLKASQHVFVWTGEQFHIWSQSSAGVAYLSRMVAHFVQVGGWNKWHQGNFLLLHGDVYLSRIDREVSYPEPVRDSEQNPLFIPNQTYLVLCGWTDAEETRGLLEGAKIADWEELHYDWDRLKQNWDTKAMVILENTTGACFAAYRELVDYAHRQAQK